MMLVYARGLQFDEKPDYDYLRKLLEEARKNNGCSENQIFDWETIAKV